MTYFPPGWQCLQELARKATTPDELNRIVNEMNKLLREYERSENSTVEPIHRAF